ncbi:hypothetical protein K432DRAFT_288747 [Lepidopterella palustris CBS 459.81]|uniref:DRBM domain-containing protein n=1 Tax=Lepidopterella palustris CBS 459.81 TaxID=1314670 RepID=A0A8E2JJE0_9PEZI|nr:hypothetical protein K432DRAFT_288747 [Lepidopterella palustris CBS 459.81]
MDVRAPPAAVQAPATTFENTPSQPNLPTALHNVYSIDAFEKLHANQQQSSLPTAKVSIRSSANTVTFTQRCQSLALQPVYDYTGDTLSGWGAKVTFGEEVIEDLGPYQSKKDAKEKVSEAGVQRLQELDAKGALARKRIKVGTGTQVEPEQTLSKSTEGPVENWIGILQEFAISVGDPSPTYTEYQIGNSFSCETEIPERPGHVFGGKSQIFANKKGARFNAAREAVEWLRAEGFFPESGPVRKKKANGNNPGSSTSGEGKIDTTGGSYAQKVAALALTLGLLTPEWRFAPPDPRAPGFCTVAAYFPHSPNHAGPIGEVRHVFGKKAAKEECAKKVLTYLKDLERERTEFAHSMLDSLKKS